MVKLEEMIKNKQIKNMFKKATALMEEGKLKEARELFEKIQEQDSNYASLKDFMEKLNELEAEEKKREEERKKKEQAELIQNMLKNLKDNEGILKLLKEIAEEGSDTDEKLVLAKAYSICYSEGKIEESLELVKKALFIRSDYEDAVVLFKYLTNVKELKDKGKEAFTRGSWKDAKKYYEEALELDLQSKYLNSLFYTNIASVLMKEEKVDEAIKACNMSLKLNPKWITAYKKRAKCFVMIHEYDDATRDLNIAIKIDPNDESLKKQLQVTQNFSEQAPLVNYYQILGIDRHMSIPDEEKFKMSINKKVRKLKSKWHPDRHEDEHKKLKAEKMCHKIDEAADILLNQASRYDYNEKYDKQFPT
mmetsp:Transcript_8728/g.12908  ORF Transcript_8728/g.12908 Transcript_8728/m.12908 type:complete len:363 (-) Transcript_8728:31-1119(-)